MTIPSPSPSRAVQRARSTAWPGRAPATPATSGEPVVLLGDSGTGKSHLLIGLGMAACQRGLRVRYTTAAALVNELAEAADERFARSSSECISLHARQHGCGTPRSVIVA